MGEFYRVKSEHRPWPNDQPQSAPAYASTNSFPQNPRPWPRLPNNSQDLPRTVVEREHPRAGLEVKQRCCTRPPGIVLCEEWEETRPQHAELASDEPRVVPASVYCSCQTITIGVLGIVKLLLYHFTSVEQRQLSRGEAVCFPLADGLDSTLWELIARDSHALSTDQARFLADPAGGATPPDDCLWLAEWRVHKTCWKISYNHSIGQARNLTANTMG